MYVWRSNQWIECVFISIWNAVLSSRRLIIIQYRKVLYMEFAFGIWCDGCLLSSLTRSRRSTNQFISFGFYIYSQWVREKLNTIPFLEFISLFKNIHYISRTRLYEAKQKRAHNRKRGRRNLAINEKLKHE